MYVCRRPETKSNTPEITQQQQRDALCEALLASTALDAAETQSKRHRIFLLCTLTGAAHGTNIYDVLVVADEQVAEDASFV